MTSSTVRLGGGRSLGAFRLDGLDAFVGVHQLGNAPGQEVEEALDGGQTLIPGGVGVSALALKAVQEVQHPLGSDRLYVDGLGIDVEALAEVVDEQSHAVAVAGDGVGRESELCAEVGGEEGGDQRAERDLHGDGSIVRRTCCRKRSEAC